MKIGKLEFNPITEAVDIASPVIFKFVKSNKLENSVYIAEIEDKYADTESFCRQYDVNTKYATNCLILEAKRSDNIWHASCLVKATDKADVNGIIRKEMNARKISFASKDEATSLTSMEYGGITPIGLPKNFKIFVDDSILDNEAVIVGGGNRTTKLAIKTTVFAHNDLFLTMNIKK